MLASNSAKVKCWYEINKEVNEQIRAIQESVGQKLMGVQSVTEVSESSKQVFGNRAAARRRKSAQRKQRGNPVRLVCR